jgi:hypothetical protein
MFDVPIEEEFAAADLVVEAKIVGVEGKCSPSKCENSAYDISVSTMVFTSGQVNAASEIKICAQSRLGLGETFVFMLRHVRDIGVDDPSTPVDESAGRCTYFANFGAVFLKYTTDLWYRHGSPEASTLVGEHGVQYLTIGKRQDGLIDALKKLAAKRSSLRQEK